VARISVNVVNLERADQFQATERARAADLLQESSALRSADFNAISFGRVVFLL
jgi:hypothetical protein